MELLILLPILCYALFAKKEQLIYLLVLGVPFHTFIKSTINFYWGGGELFSFWKEIVVLILLIKTFKGKIIKPDNGLSTVIVAFSILVILFLLLSPVIGYAFPTLRDHIFPLLLLLCVACMPLNQNTLRKIIMYTCIVAILNCVMGFLQSFLLNIPISTLMGTIDFIDSAGYVQYKTTSFRIMGIERMSGIIGGPNSFGIYYGFIIVFITGVFMNLKRFPLSVLQKRTLILTLILSVSCIIFSFSRAGWVIALLGVFLLLRFNKIKIPVSYYIRVGMLGLIGAAVVLIQFPYVAEVITNSVSGKEDSVADRGNNFSNALNLNLTEPWGHGLGTTDNRIEGKEFFAESAFMNIFYEIGFVGFVILLSIHILIIKKCLDYKKLKSAFMPSTALALTIPTILVCFVSINPYGIPYIYLWWLILGIGINPSVNSLRHQ